MGCSRGWGWGGMFGGCGFPHPHHYDRDYEYYGPRDEGPIRDEIDRIYAAGKINRDEYHLALHRLKQGSFTLDDLWELRNRDEVSKGPGARHEDPRQATRRGEAASPGDISRALDDLHGKKAEVERAEGETADLLQKLRGSVAKLNEEMLRYESLAKGAVGVDESQARLYLQRRQTAAEQMAGLEARIKELEKDLERLQALKTDLDARILELAALGQRDRLARLESEIKGIQP
ncbi:MAG: hypothetical protein M1598_10380 [Actinobacteria bacterium]|nr:hypothetical protein [Actinomycetota bacterium]